MPSASVTAKIASISFIVTASSMDPRLRRDVLDLLPRGLVDRNAVRAALALAACLRLAGNQNLLRAGGERRGAHPVAERRHLSVELRRGHEPGRIDAHDERAVAEDRLLAA